MGFVFADRGQKMEQMQKNSLAEAVTALFGEGIKITGRRAVYGGDINESYRLGLSDGSSVFVKLNARRNLSFFEAEAAGLQALSETQAIGVPKVLSYGTVAESAQSFLMLEYLEPGRKVRGYWEIFGRELAMMHLFESSRFTGEGEGRFGFVRDNYIGASPQKNTPKDTWISFFRDCRLLPQITAAEGYFDSGTRRQFDYLLEHLDQYLVEPERPSLIHGDLWSGNVVCGPDGKAWILDPAVYVGHFEAELAMTELFGRNPEAFYRSYSECNRIDRGYRDRKDLYNLYHLLNHLNLFGGSYYGSVVGILRRYV